MTDKEREAYDAYSNAVSGAAERVGPAVVRIDAHEGASRSGRKRSGGQGSGVIFDSSGRVLTNEHVVRKARSLTVTLPDGRAFPAAVEGADASVDLAVLRVPDTGHNLPVAELSNAKMRIGQLVVAVGNPFGLNSTVTAGVISALGRELPVSRSVKLTDLIQTDVPINPGNSGGPLVDARGRVVGITTAVMPFARGLGFAVPTKTVTATLARLMVRRSKDGGRLGVSVMTYPLERTIARERNLPLNSGALLLEVFAGSPASDASLRSQDVIVSIDGDPIGDVGDISRALNKTDPKQSLEIGFLRGSRLGKTKVVMSE